MNATKIKVPLPRILIYQREEHNTLIDYLSAYGFKIITTTDEDVLKKIREGLYDICILDHFRACIPGDLKLLRYQHKINRKMPVIFLSDLFNYEYIIKAFNEGVDDYVIRPYNIEELICRIKAILKRCNVKTRDIEDSYKIGLYTFNVKLNLITIGESEQKITNKEGKTLALLCAYKNELLPKDIVLNSVWRDNNSFNKRSLDVHICHIRNYLNKDNRIKINTVRGLGYSLVINEDDNNKDNED